MSAAEALWRTKVSPVIVQQPKLYEYIEYCRNKTITGEHPYVYMDSIALKCSWDGEARNVLVLVAMAAPLKEGGLLGKGETYTSKSWKDFNRSRTTPSTS